MPIGRSIQTDIELSSVFSDALQMIVCCCNERTERPYNRYPIRVSSVQIHIVFVDRTSARKPNKLFRLFYFALTFKCFKT